MRQRDLAHLIVAVLVFGSIWGLLEATLGGFLNLVVFLNKGAIMGGIGMTIMGAALAIYRQPAMLPGIGIVAASFKLLNVWVLFVPVNAVHVINPAMAIILESVAFGLVAAVAMNQMGRSPVAGVSAGALAGLASAMAYVYFAIYITHSPVFQRLGITSIGGFITNQGLVQAAFFGVLTPVGLLIGEKLAARPFFTPERSGFYYATSAAVIVLCWGISIAVKIAGL